MILISLILMSWMIFTIVKNAIIAIQLNPKDHYKDSLELIVPILPEDYFNPEIWKKSFLEFQQLNVNNFRIHFLIEKHHSQSNELENLQKTFPFIEIHFFTTGPENIDAAPWMISQIKDQIKGKFVLLGDPDVIPSEKGLISIAYNLEKFERPLIVLPQVSQQNPIGEALESLGPGVALISLVTIKRKAKYFFYGLIGLSKSWLGMSLSQFKEITWQNHKNFSWKDYLYKHWEYSEAKLKLAFGEKFLIKHYPENYQLHLKSIFKYYQFLWTKGDRNTLFLYFMFQFIWFIPLALFWVYPLWTVAGLILILFYRFFTKIIFQESWISVCMHPISNCLHFVGLSLPLIDLLLKKKSTTKE